MANGNGVHLGCVVVDASNKSLKETIYWETFDCNICLYEVNGDCIVYIVVLKTIFLGEIFARLFNYKFKPKFIFQHQFKNDIMLKL